MGRPRQQEQQGGPTMQQQQNCMSLAVGVALMAEQYRQDGCANEATLAKKMAGDLVQLGGITPGVASGFIDSLPTALGGLGMPSSSGGASSSSAVFAHINIPAPGVVQVSAGVVQVPVAQQPQQQQAAPQQVGPRPQPRAIKLPVCATANADCRMKLQLGSNHIAKNCGCYCSYPRYHVGPHSFERAIQKRRCRPVNLNGHN